ncbi:MAG: hypothetical protein M5U29_02090 [Anaerolineae bacterium]|nr:hypothetical protein [Anaerolineae bacterium]
MERRTCGIALALGLVLLSVVAAVAVGLLFAYEVSVPATLLGVSGDVQRARSHQRPQPLDPQSAAGVRLQAGDSLLLAPHSTATVALDLFGGRILLEGPLTFTLRESSRRATLAGHLVTARRLARDYTLTLEQDGGTASYVFSNADPPLASLSITMRLPETSFTPGLPCWSVVFKGDGSSPTVREYDCAPLSQS